MSRFHRHCEINEICPHLHHLFQLTLKCIYLHCFLFFVFSLLFLLSLSGHLRSNAIYRHQRVPWTSYTPLPYDLRPWNSWTSWTPLALRPWTSVDLPSIDFLLTCIFCAILKRYSSPTQARSIAIKVKDIANLSISLFRHLEACRHTHHRGLTLSGSVRLTPLLFSSIYGWTDTVPQSVERSFLRT